MTILLGVLLVVGLMIAIGHFSSEPCPKCGTRGTVKHRHTKVDGGPDRRYKDNPKVCSNCGWTSAA